MTWRLEVLLSQQVLQDNSIEGLDPPVSISFLKNPVYITMIDLILVVNLIFSYRVSMVQVFSALIGTPFQMVKTYVQSSINCYQYITNIDGYGDWSSDGCKIDESYIDTQDYFTCFCDHLTSFSILLVGQIHTSTTLICLLHYSLCHLLNQQKKYHWLLH